MMDNLSVIRSGDISIIFNHDNDMFNIQELSDFIGCKNILSSIVKDPLNGAMYVIRDVSGQKWGDIVALVRFGCMLNKSVVKDLIIKCIRLWVEKCDISYNNAGLSISDPIYDTFLFKSYMSVAGDNTDLNRFIVTLRSRMLTYDLKSLYLYLAMFMAINGGILLSEEDLLAALIL
jgi:hypothetical protein